MAASTLSSHPKAALFSVLREKRAARQSRVKMARHLLHMQVLKQELANYNLTALQKAAAANTHRQTRIKFAALTAQYHVEKRAFVTELLHSRPVR